MKSPKVTVRVHDPNYKVKVNVYRHVTTPDTISVNIVSIHPVQPPEPADTEMDRVVELGSEVEFVAELYPPEVAKKQ
jgi:hypothetical protein